MKDRDTTAGAGDRAEADVIRAPATQALPVPATSPVSVPLPAIGGARTAEELEQLAHDMAKPRSDSDQPAAADGQTTATA